MDEELLVLERRGGKLLVDIHILLVDDDATSLAVVSAMLRLCNYQVVTLKNPLEALDTLRARKGFFDIVLTDLHMPQMNGLQLQKQVMQEFKLPVIMMSADEKPSVILKSLEEGVAFYLVKPVTLDDLKHVWQYAITAKKVITPNRTTSSTIILRELSTEKSSSSSAPCSKKETIKSKLDGKSKKKKEKENRVTRNSIAIRKAKVIWTNSLHNRFLQAIRLIGLDKAVPKKILEFMNVPGLTRENVASHLQKYRIFLKRVAEKGTHRSMKYTLLRSSFASSHFQPAFYTSKFQSNYPCTFPKKQQLMAPSLNYQCPVILLGANNLSHITPPNPNIEGASMENSMPHLENQKYSSLSTINKLPRFPFNGLISSTTQDDQNFVSVENENPTCSSKGETRGTTISTGEDRMSCSGQDGLCNVQAPHDQNKEGLGLNIGGTFCGTFEGTNQLLQMICNKSVEEIGSVLVASSSSSEELNNVNTRKATNESMGFGDIGREDQNCFDVLSEIFKGHNHNQTSLRKEEMGDVDLSDIWNGIEMDASSPKQDLQPSGLYAQGWDDDILEIFNGDGSLS